MRRHDGLRATFRWAGEHLEQVVGKARAVDLPLEEATTANAAARAAQRFGGAPYDLTGGPLFRFKLIRLEPDDHLLLCGFHHLVFDGGSWPIFVEELTAGLSAERPPDRPLPSPDDGAGRAARPDRAAWREARDYWRAKGCSLSAGWELAPDRRAAGRRDTEGAHVVTVLPDDLSAGLRRAARRLRSTPFRTALAAFAAFLRIIARRDDIVVATTLTGRSAPELRTRIGMFVNTGLISLEIPGRTTFRKLQRKVLAQVDEAVGRQDFPFLYAVREASLPRDATRNPFTEVSFIKMPRPVARRIGDLKAAERRIFLPGVDRDLAVYLQEGGRKVSLTWAYRAGRFEPSTIARFADLFQSLLACALERPDEALDQLDLVTEQERRRILIDWNDTDRAFPDRKVLHRLVEDQVARTPDRIAVVSAERDWSYRQINAAANALAHVLRERGVGRGSFVPLLLAPSADLLIAELAVLKCGAAFAPLAPEWPRRRIEALLGQLGTRLLVVRDAGSARAAPPGSDCVDLALVDLEKNPGNPATDCGLNDPIYCLFTSGSTGVPKGAVNLHRGIVNRLLSMSETFGTAVDEVVLVTAAGVADTHVWQFFWPLICGGRVVVAPRGQVVAPDHIRRLIAAHGVTTADFVPSIFESFVRHLARRPQGSDLGALRRILIGGETMTAAAVYAFKARFPKIHIYNIYGPTETSIGAIYLKVPDVRTDPVPIGRPFPNIRAVVLDQRLRLTPVGVIGELCLGGDCVGLGYLGDAEATREKFVPNPYPELRCDVLYRTGDLARMRPDGVIECLGRIDDQIKIRGVRIEPGEIEATLVRHPSVDQALVSLAAAPGAEPQLMARLVLAKGAPTPGATELQAFLRRRLPAYTAPSTFVRVEQLPLGPTGKVDRRSAPFLKGELLSRGRPFEGPRTGAESCLAEVWREVLQIDRISVHDNFFTDLNGDSLKALLFVLRLEERTGRKTEVSQLFEAPTIAALAPRLAKSTAESSPTARGRSPPGDTPPPDLVADLLDRQRPYVSTWRGARVSPDSFLFARNSRGKAHPLFWCCQGFRELFQLARSLGPDQPVVGMRSGHLIMDYSDRNIDALASHYAREIERVQPEGPIHLAGNCQGACIAQGVARRLTAVGREVALLLLMEETVFRSYDGRVALLFGRDSHLNPYNTAPDADAVFRRAYSGGYTVTVIPGGHGRFFTEQNVPVLAAAVAERLKEAAPSFSASLRLLGAVA